MTQQRADGQLILDDFKITQMCLANQLNHERMMQDNIYASVTK